MKVPDFDIEQARQIVREERHLFYKHALIEAKKDGVRPDDVVYIILTGKIIEEYPERKRFLVYGTIFNNIPLHAVCDVSVPGILFIVTVYIPDSLEWIDCQIRKVKKQ
jgi:hypothetical protein